MDCSSCSICVTACPACVGSKTMPEPNCACAAGWNAVTSPTASAVRISFFIALSFPLRLVWESSYGNTALLLCGENFSLYLCKTVRFWLAPCFSCFLLGFDSRCLLRGQLLSGHKSFGCGAVFFQASLGISWVFGVVLILQLLDLFGFALAADKGENRQE